MRFATSRTNINPPFPIKQAGHLSQVDNITEVHDPLEARLLYLENDKMIWLHCSCDNLGFNIEFQNNLEKQCNAFYNKETHVTVSTTHSHHCADSTIKEYADFAFNQILEAAKQLEISELGELEITYQTIFFDQVGKSRISHHISDSVQLDLFEIKKETKVLADIIIHNVHPTILQADTPYFSAEYPGYVLGKLNGLEPDVFHTFIQGAAGDNSTRFTRPSQDYSAVEYLGEKLLNQILELKKVPLPSQKLTLSFDCKTIALEHEFDPIDLGELPDDLSEREKETIGYGQIMRQRLKEHPENLKKEILISKVDLGMYRILFAPNEMFSWYRTQMNNDFCALGCYSNGYAPYICGPNQHLLTYETFTDTVTKAKKEEIAALLKKWGN